MNISVRRFAAISSFVLVVALWGVALQAASPTVQQALKLRPVQAGVDIARPTAEEVAKCTISAARIGGHVGWVVTNPNGLILRKFVDTDGNNVVDRWSYYKDGLEVYRDIDTDHNGKPDQYRWFHTGGSRWGVDNNADGKIDIWKKISAEEVTAEVIAALASGRAERFTRLVLTPEELISLGLGKVKAAAVEKKIQGLAERFKTLAAEQKIVTPGAQWIQFSGTRPGIVPAGTDGSSKDLRVYENVVAIVRVGDRHVQVQIGTLVEVGEAWRLIDLPQPIAEGQAEVSDSGFFFRAANVARTQPSTLAPSAEAEKLLAELEKLDQANDRATTPQEKAQFVTRRAELLERIAQRSRDPRDRAMWLRQLADMLSAAAQTGTCPDGAKRLEELFQKLTKNQADKDLAAHVKFLSLTAAYALSLQAKDADFHKIQTQWLKDLQQYAADYPTAPDAAEAMLQLAIAQEFAEKENEAKTWYGRIVKDFPNSSAAKKAAGARTRLDSVGKTIRLSGKSATGSTIDLARYRGRVVLIQYWATWSERAKADMPTLKELVSKYGRSLSVIGVNLDSSRKDLADFLAANKLPWPQIFEEGGLDSRPANQLGILALPTMILVDTQGRVVNRNIQTAELETALRKLIR